MSELTDLYQEALLDHYRAPRNFRRLAGSIRRAEGFNPLCGDRVAVYVDLDGGRVKDASFQGSGCAISTASASILTENVKGKTREEIASLFDRFHALVTSEPGAEVSPDLGKLAVFAGVREFPVRVKCATLAWHTLRAALDGKEETVSTEAPQD
ncbi:MAG TPA: SUF system NifU family Fe-S cluster assembly protein [Planctomycetota bacterium]|jgi:nitrogen fixation NifU-like protein|nr:SUF system NifU family Fe-S cluster assembly protein [Planctomycetota bacterium]